MSTQSVPHLTTALSGPLHQIENHLLNKQVDIESWFRGKWRLCKEPFYASVDIRNAGFKMAPVDTNLFPSGFNNLNPVFQPLCIQAIQLTIEKMAKKIDRILIIPENHTRNQFYMENLFSFNEIIEKAGFNVRLGSMMEDIKELTTIRLESGHELHLQPLIRKDNHVCINGFIPELVILNNDLSSGRPGLLEELDQIVTPILDMGWSNRLKSRHFAHYQNIVKEFASFLNMDPWLIEPMFRNCGEIDFMKREGGSCLSKNVEALLKAIQEKYDEYDVKCQPFVMVKADAGTYGMGVMTVKSPDEVSELNRKQRTSMSTIKEGQKVTKVIIQEGVYTYETWGDEATVAEPVIYMIGHNVVGGFYRVHSKRTANENLNAPGMRFEPLAFDDCCISPEKNLAPDAHPNRFYVYGVIARLAMLAAAQEMAA